MSARVVPLRPGVSLEPWLSKSQLAAHLGRSTRWVELKAREGLPSLMIGGRRAYRVSEVEAWLREQVA